MKNSEIRKKARECLEGKWGKVALITLLFSIIQLVLSSLTSMFEKSSPFLSLIINIISLLVNVPLTYGLFSTFVKIKRNEEVSTTNFIDVAFDNFGRSWGIALRIILKTLVPFIVTIVLFTLIGSMQILRFYSGSGSSFATVILFVAFIFASIWLTIRTLFYSLSYIAAYENPEMDPKDIINNLQQLSKNNATKLFLLVLSFIGWAILACFTLGIGILWLLPYMYISYVIFYDDISNN